MSQTLTMEQVTKYTQGILVDRCNLITKIKAKCWAYHSQSRIKNGNEPFSFDIYSRVIDAQSILSYIEYDNIEVDDLGGKAEVISAVKKWYSY